VVEFSRVFVNREFIYCGYFVDKKVRISDFKKSLICYFIILLKQL